ncbi:hypothetical protein FHETE_3813 [Fusarium heterosporum]|uniref:Uncharacterized protein n=1 Tax=Fusarium heterosporum TaxID=42747 RepID=A0A8H5TMW2_FUSHE|nr:hypothetical protein FHETE_3813 [Fusarium heterosporum]
MKLVLLVWATGAIAGPCKPSRPATSTGYSVPGSLSTVSTMNLSTRVHGQPDQSTKVDSSTGTLSTGSVSFVSLPSTSIDTDETETSVINTDTADIPGTQGPGDTQAGVIDTQTGSQKPASTQTAAVGTETRGTATPKTDTTRPTGTDTETQVQVTQPEGTQTGNLPGSGLSDSVTSGSSSVDVPGTIGDQTSLDAPSGTHSGDVPGTIRGETSYTQGHPSSPSPGTEVSSAGTAEVTGTFPVNVPDATTFPNGDSTETSSGSIPSETPSREASVSDPVSQTDSDATLTGGDNPGNTGTGSFTNSDLTGGPAPTGTDNNPPADGTSAGAEPASTETGSTSEATGFETGSNTQNVPGTSSTTEGFEPGATGTDTGLPATETATPGESQSVESSSASVPNVETETNATELPQVTGSATSGIATLPADITTKPDAGVTDSLPASTVVTDLPAVTEAPGVTTAQTQPAPTATVTQVPSDWAPTCVSGHTEWTADTWITTTVDGFTTPTVVPVLVDADDCDSDGSGLILWGFPHVTGTQFNLPGAPPFSLPCIPPFCSTPPKVEPVGGSEGDDGDDDSSKSDKSSATCTDTSTVSNCLVECTTRTGIDVAPTPECTTTCSQTATGCSVTGTTTTTEVDACSATGDVSSDCSTCPSELDNSDLGSELEPESDLTRRWNGPEKNAERRVGRCSAESLGTTFKYPNYPAGPDIFMNEKALAQPNNRSPLKDVPRWFWKEMDRTTCRPVLKGLGNSEAAQKRVNVATIDHVYEKSFLRDYWSYITRQGGRNVYGSKPVQKPAFITCDDLKNYGGTSMSLVKDVYMKYPGATQNGGDTLNPSEANWLGDFVGMDQWTNQAKNMQGIATTPREILVRNNAIPMVGANNLINPILATIGKRLDLVGMVQVGVQLANLGGLQGIMVRQNTRIYQALQAMDKAALGKCESAVKSGMWSFADRYKDLMTSRFDGTIQGFSINPMIATNLGEVRRQLLADFESADQVITAMPETNDREKTVKANWRKKYNDLMRVWDSIVAEIRTRGLPKINTPAWEWPALAKRADDGDLGICHVDLPTTSLATTFSTIVSTSSADDQTTNSVPAPTTTAIVCESDNDCGSMDCSDDEIPFCNSRLGQLPGLPKFCSCVAKPIATTPPTTTTAQEPKPTTSSAEIAACKTNDDCKDHLCNEGYHPICGSGNPLFPVVPFCHCTSDITLPPPTSTKEAPPPEDTHAPNDDFPEVECSTHADCGKWQGVCPRGNKYCTATDWEVINGIPTSKRAICKC